MIATKIAKKYFPAFIIEGKTLLESYIILKHYFIFIIPELLLLDEVQLLATVQLLCLNDKFAFSLQKSLSITY